MRNARPVKRRCCRFFRHSSSLLIMPRRKIRSNFLLFAARAQLIHNHLFYFNSAAAAFIGSNGLEIKSAWSGKSWLGPNGISADFMPCVIHALLCDTYKMCSLVITRVYDLSTKCDWRAAIYKEKLLVKIKVLSQPENFKWPKPKFVCNYTNTLSTRKGPKWVWYRT